MKKSIVFYITIIALCCPLFQSCDEETTYADQKDRERSGIGSFISKGICIKDPEVGDTVLYVAPIKPISEAQFFAQDSTTNISKNEYVLFNNTGVYMQIIRKGPGKKLEHNESENIYCRYMEVNIFGDSIQTRNNTPFYIAIPDVMTCYNSYGTFTASFISGVMRGAYTASVPAGWLVPLTYINIGRQIDDKNEIAKVRIIVPHTQGQQNATSSVYPCFYEITYQKGR
ncbi:MAG: DUF4827 domain-containing protein [Bacteroidaceae bacterium]